MDINVIAVCSLILISNGPYIFDYIGIIILLYTDLFSNIRDFRVLILISNDPYSSDHIGIIQCGNFQRRCLLRLHLPARSRFIATHNQKQQSAQQTCPYLFDDQGVICLARRVARHEHPVGEPYHPQERDSPRHFAFLPSRPSFFLFLPLLFLLVAWPEKLCCTTSSSLLEETPTQNKSTTQQLH